MAPLALKSYVDSNVTTLQNSINTTNTNLTNGLATKQNTLSISGGFLALSNSVLSIDLSTIYNKAQVDAIVAPLATKAYVDSNVSTLNTTINAKQNTMTATAPLALNASSQLTIDLSSYYPKSQVDNIVAPLATTAALNSGLATKQNSITVSAPLSLNASSQLSIDLSLYYTKIQSDVNYYNKSVTYTKSEADAIFNTKQNILTFSQPLQISGTTVSLNTSAMPSLTLSGSNNLTVGGSISVGQGMTASPFFSPLNVFNTGLASGNQIYTSLGISSTTNNCFQVGFVYSGTSGSISNYGALGLYGSTALSIYGDKSIVASGNLTVNGTIYQGINMVATTSYVGTNVATLNTSIATKQTSSPLLLLAASTAGYTLIGTNATDGATNTRIVLSGYQRPSPTGSIEYLTSAAGAHIWYNQGTSLMSLGNTGVLSTNEIRPSFINYTNTATGTPLVGNTMSAGTKLLLYNTQNASVTNYAIGIESYTLWNSVPDTNSFFRWYSGASSGCKNIMQLTGYGQLNITYQNDAAYAIPLYMSAPVSQGKNVQIQFGSSGGGVNNSFQIGFNYAGGSGSGSNYGYLGIAGAANALQWYADGRVTVANRINVPTLYLGGNQAAAYAGGTMTYYSPGVISLAPSGTLANITKDLTVVGNIMMNNSLLVATQIWTQSQGYLTSLSGSVVKLAPTAVNGITEVGFASNTDYNAVQTYFKMGRGSWSTGVDNFAIGADTASAQGYIQSWDRFGNSKLVKNLSIGLMMTMDSGITDAPQKTTRSNGTRIVYYSQVSSNDVDYAVGIDGGTVWHSVPNTSGTFKWYGGDVPCMTLSGAGLLSPNGLSINNTANILKCEIGGEGGYAGASNSGWLDFQFYTGGYKHYIRSRHDGRGLVPGNSVDFWLNSSTTVGGSASPGVGNVQVLSLQATSSIFYQPVSITATSQMYYNWNDLTQNTGAALTVSGDSLLHGTVVISGRSSVSYTGTNGYRWFAQAGVGNVTGGFPANYSFIMGAGARMLMMPNSEINNISDRRTKKHIANIDDALTIVQSISAKRFRYIEGDGSLKVGFIAQDCSDLCPEVVTTMTDPEGNERYTMNLKGMTAYLWNAVRELTAEVEKLKEQK
ncbi:hypothetical protein HDV00_008971 [Rhizophlyctis rosea]|nr:hypothetical protein HDV00_008971 [Rhizophlyctis rosea]